MRIKTKLYKSVYNYVAEYVRRNIDVSKFNSRDELIRTINMNTSIDDYLDSKFAVNFNITGSAGPMISSAHPVDSDGYESEELDEISLKIQMFWMINMNKAMAISDVIDDMGYTEEYFSKEK